MNYNVVFCPGSYGTYLAWAVYTYSSLNKQSIIEIPFGAAGSAHLFRKQKGISVVPTMHQLPSYESNVIYIKPTPGHEIEYLDNQYMKQLEFNDNETLENILGKEYQEKIQSIWGSTTPNRWEQREFLSFFLDSMFKNQTSEYNNLSLTKFSLVEIESIDIIDNLYQALMKIFNFFDLKANEITIKHLTAIHNDYCILQKNFNKGKITLEYAKASIAKRKYTIKNCTIYDEAWIQHLLRKKGFEIRCYDLNHFPICASELACLLEKIND